MSDDSGYEGMENASREEILSAIFANIIVQNANMAFIFMGRVPHPETGEVMRDIESAQMFIDQLEALELKTRGNLSPQEQALMSQSLTTVRMAFVDATGGKIKRPEPVPFQPRDSQPPQLQQNQEAQQPFKNPEATNPPAATPPPAPPKTGPEPPEESRKKFVKKY